MLCGDWILHGHSSILVPYFGQTNSILPIPFVFLKLQDIQCWGPFALHPWNSSTWQWQSMACNTLKNTQKPHAVITYITLHYMIFDYIILSYVALYYAILYCIILYYVTVHYSVLQCIQAYIHTYIHAYIQRYIHTKIHIVNIHIDIRTHTHVHMYTSVCVCAISTDSTVLQYAPRRS